MKIKIGTRSSPLAMAQTSLFVQRLAMYKVDTVIVPIATMGDKDTQTPINQFGQTGVFTSALNKAVLEGEIDCAVHSCKDLPSVLEHHLAIAAVLARGSSYDSLISNIPYHKLLLTSNPLTIATGSVRRKAQWLNARPGDTIVDLRGNIQTRLQKLNDNNYDGIIMAQTALERLNLTLDNTAQLEFTPAPCQGIIAIVTNKKQIELNKLLQKINHLPSYIEMLCEREFLKQMQAGCNTPLACKATYNKGKLDFNAELYHPETNVKRAFTISKNADKFHAMVYSAWQYFNSTAK